MHVPGQRQAPLMKRLIRRSAVLCKKETEPDLAFLLSRVSVVFWNTWMMEACHGANIHYYC
jgi:hypothetical protein